MDVSASAALTLTLDDVVSVVDTHQLDRSQPWRRWRRVAALATTDVKLNAWRFTRVVSVGVFIGLIAVLFERPATGLFVFWRIIIPLLPILFFLAPGVWRNVCPLAAANQLPRLFGFSRSWNPPRFLRERGYVVAISLFFVIVATRKVILNDNGTALAILLAALLCMAFLGGIGFKGKSGWCSSICPLLPVQRLYGQTPFVTVRNNHCEPCVGCAKNCYDASPEVAYQTDLNDRDVWWATPRQFFAGAFPGVVLAFAMVPSASGSNWWTIYVAFACYIGLSAATFFALEAKTPVTRGQLAAVYGGIAINLFYFFNGPTAADTVHQLTGVDVTSALAPMQLLLLQLAVVWVVRTARVERRVVGESPADDGVVLSLRSPAAPSAGGAARTAPSGEPSVQFLPDDVTVSTRRGMTILEAAEEVGLPIEVGCRMGMCGADPVAVLDGAGCLSAVGDAEAATLARLGLAEGTRLACCAQVNGAVSVSLDPAHDHNAPVTAAEPEVPFDEGIRSVVVIGNGIAGVTAAQVVRRNHSACEIHVIGRESFPLYNRMGISRLVYGRSAMKGLYLMDEEWYDEHRITHWVNTQVKGIDCDAQEVHLGTGERLSWDRLILATGSQSTVPQVPGIDLDGSFVLREAADAMAIRSYVQEHRAEHAIVAGGGLLGLEAAYALRQLGVRTTVLERSERLLRRQIDERASELLRGHLGRAGIDVIFERSVEAVNGEARVESITTTGGLDVDADMLVVCAGITPNVELAKLAGLDTGRGVIVDDHLQTSSPGVFAAGDVAELFGSVAGLWPAAIAQAEIAARNALGGDEACVPETPITILKGVDLELTSAGRLTALDDEEVIVRDDPRTRTYGKLVISGGRVVGAVFVGRPQEARLGIAAVRENRDVTPVLERLRAGDWTALDATTIELTSPADVEAPAMEESRVLASAGRR